MKKYIGGLAFLALSLPTIAHAGLVLSYVERTENRHGSAYAQTTSIPRFSGDTSVATGAGRFDLSPYWDSQLLRPRLTIRTATISSSTRDDFDSFEEVSSIITSRNPGPGYALQGEDADYEYFVNRQIDNVFRILQTANERFTIEAGTFLGESNWTSVVSATPLQEKQTITSSRYLAYQPWDEFRIGNIDIYCSYPGGFPAGQFVCGHQSFYERIHHKGRIFIDELQKNVTGLALQQSGYMTGDLTLNGDQFMAAAPDFDLTRSLSFTQTFYGDQSPPLTTLRFNYDVSFLMPVWTYVPDQDPPTSKVPEPASMALLLLGLTGLGFARRSRRSRK